MEPQIPTGYENYPHPEERERQAGANGWENPPPPAPVVRSYQGSGAYRPSPPQGSRRSMLAGVVGVGVVAVVGLGLFKRPAAGDQADTSSDYQGQDPFDPGTDGEVDTSVLSFGGQDIDVPDGWTVLADTEDRALLMQGHNQILVVRYEASSSDAAEEVRDAVRQSGTAFDGDLPKPKTSTGDGYERAVTSGSGTFDGRPARQIAEVLLSDELSVLFIQQVLTAGKNSATAKATARLAADLRDSWPW